jgi:protein-S-isoprenylcysteine O-methyltransferase Ste14
VPQAKILRAEPTAASGLFLDQLSLDDEAPFVVRQGAGLERHDGLALDRVHRLDVIRVYDLLREEALRSSGTEGGNMLGTVARMRREDRGPSVNATLKTLYFLGVLAEVLIRIPHERRRRRTRMAVERVDAL